MPSSLRCFSSQPVSTRASGCAYCVGCVAIRPQISIRFPTRAIGFEPAVGGVWDASPLSLVCAVPRKFHLVPNRDENFGNADLIRGVGQERREVSTAISVDTISRTSLN